MWYVTYGMWHVTYDWWQAKRYTWNVTHGRWWTFYQNVRSLAFKIIWTKESPTEWMNELINDECVCKTATATLPLLKLRFHRNLLLFLNFCLISMGMVEHRRRQQTILCVKHNPTQRVLNMQTLEGCSYPVTSWLLIKS